MSDLASFLLLSVPQFRWQIDLDSVSADRQNHADLNSTAPTRPTPLLALLLHPPPATLLPYWGGLGVSCHFVIPSEPLPHGGSTVSPRWGRRATVNARACASVTHTHGLQTSITQKNGMDCQGDNATFAGLAHFIFYFLWIWRMNWHRKSIISLRCEQRHIVWPFAVSPLLVVHCHGHANRKSHQGRNVEVPGLDRGGLDLKEGRKREFLLGFVLQKVWYFTSFEISLSFLWCDVCVSPFWKYWNEIYFSKSLFLCC